jgi:DNA-binding response OmpR family regulator
MKNRILIVDDEPDIVSVFKMVLEDNGFVVDTFNDPLLALQNFSADSYDLLLLDIIMPKMNGVELYQKMRMLDDKFKVCFLTAGKINLEELKMKVALIMDDTKKCFISKPIENEELLKRVKTRLE